jgi:ABC-type histidine transport system ATPase subunit
MTLLTLEALTKRFGDHVVLGGIDLSVVEGETVSKMVHAGSGR